MQNTALRIPLALVLAVFGLGGCAVQPAAKEEARVMVAAEPPPATPAVPTAPAEPMKEKKEKKAKVTYYLAPADVDVKAVLPGPPAEAGTALSRAEIQLIMAIEADATEAVMARAKREGDLQPWIFAEVLGEAFSKERMPRTAELLERAVDDTEAIYQPAKKMWARQRPYQEDARVSPGVPKPDNASYPSGHATRAMMWACVLARLAPEKAAALRLRAAQVAEDRLVGGVHYPSDVVAGLALGEAIAEKMASSPAFQRDMEEARGEWKK